MMLLDIRLAFMSAAHSFEVLASVRPTTVVGYNAYNGDRQYDGPGATWPPIRRHVASTSVLAHGREDGSIHKAPWRDAVWHPAGDEGEPPA